MEPNIYSINFQDSKEAEKNLEEYKGKYILIVNVASKCGLTPQYEGLKQIQDSYDKDLQVIGFPCNQFMGQEPGTDEEIQTFCKTKYDVNFPVMKKIEVNGSNTHPLYEYLKSEQYGESLHHQLNELENPFACVKNQDLCYFFMINGRNMLSTAVHGIPNIRN